MIGDWDGSERREAAALAEALDRRRAGTVEVPVAGVVVGFAAVLLLQIGAMVGHAILSNHLEQEHNNAQTFRKEIVCYVVKTTQGTAGPNVLTDCGFLDTGGTK